jgi:4-amino-4-deoxy-L-arabinose transferase-like glycosyltransferase
MLRSEVSLVLILVLLCLTLFFFRLGSRPLWDTDEGMHAATSKDMVLGGDWITPTFNGKKFFDKPILYNWLAAFAFLVLGFTELAARLPGAVLGLGCVLITYMLGRRIFGPTVGFLGAVILATSPEYIILSRAVVHDILLAFFITLSLFFFYSGYSSNRHRKRNLIFFFGACGFSVLAKGPVGVVLPVMIIGLFLIIKGELRFLKEMQIGWGAVVFLVVAAPWYILITLENGEYFRHFFIQQNLMNFFSSKAARHPEPFYYYILFLLGGFFPWSLFLPLALIRSLRHRFKEMHEGTLFLLIWVCSIFLFFSVARSKLSPYILPLFPAAALLVGSLWHELLSGPTPGLHQGFLYSYIPLVVALLLGSAYFMIYPPSSLQTSFGINLTRLSFLAFVMVTIVVFSFLMFLWRHYRLSFSANVGLVVAGIILFIVLIAPLINPYRSTKKLARKLDAMMPPGKEFVFYRGLRESALFYTRRQVVELIEETELIKYLTSNKGALCIIDRRDLDESERLKAISKVIVAGEGNDLIIAPESST